MNDDSRSLSLLSLDRGIAFWIFHKLRVRGYGGQIILPLIKHALHLNMHSYHSYHTDDTGIKKTQTTTHTSTIYYKRVIKPFVLMIRSILVDVHGGNQKTKFPCLFFHIVLLLSFVYCIFEIRNIDARKVKTGGIH